MWMCIGIIILLGIIIYFQQRIIYKKEREKITLHKQSLKFREYFELLDQWMMNREMGMSVANYCQKNGYETVAIYGMGILGKHLYHELNKSEICVKYAIDQNAKGPFDELKVCKPDEPLEEVDAVIITVTVSYGSIAQKLEEKLDCSMISLEEAICES